jgi:2-polyprenyl-3-methyl-5-hydroxy-6-metoxy-1,4-benzoquinol methylase
MPLRPHHRCWICASKRLRLARPSQVEGALESRAFAITDSHYGRTHEIHRCEDCGFLQCSELADVVGFYEDLEDPDYESTRGPRSKQMERLLVRLERGVPQAPGSRLLDVGAGSGILVEQARARGYKAAGIEPSRWLQACAQERGLPVELGTLPHSALPGPFDVVTLIDVIEHVLEPVELLREARRVLAPDGHVVVVTPDVGALVPRLLGYRWWHFRLAHVGYFDRTTLRQAFERAGLELVSLSRPTWVLDVGYLIERVSAYLPPAVRVPPPALLRRLWVPLTLGDVLFAVGRRAA